MGVCVSVSCVNEHHYVSFNNMWSNWAVQAATFSLSFNANKLKFSILKLLKFFKPSCKRKQDSHMSQFIKHMIRMLRVLQSRLFSKRNYSMNDCNKRSRKKNFSSSFVDKGANTSSTMMIILYNVELCCCHWIKHVRYLFLIKSNFIFHSWRYIAWKNDNE